MSLATCERPELDRHSVPLARTKGPRWAVWNGAALVMAAVLMRLWLLGSVPGVNGDEAWMGVQAQLWLHGEPVSWRTPTGNPLNPFFFAPQAALHALFQPSFALLRLPAALSGILALVVNFYFCRRVFGSRMAKMTTILLAVLPINIVYSRFAWDACQSLLATLPVVYLPLLAVKDEQRRVRWLGLAALAYLAAIVVHPTNIFAGPLLAIPAWGLWKREIMEEARRHLRGRRGVAAGGVALLGMAAAAWIGRHWLLIAWSRISQPDLLVAFVRYFQRLFSGLTVYQFIAGSCLNGQGLGAMLHDAVAVAMFLLAGVTLFSVAADARATLERRLLVGWAWMLLGFFLFAGPQGISPHYERYGICLIGPTAILLGRAAVAWSIRGGWQGKAGRVGLAAVGWLLLAGCGWNYFRPLLTTGGESHAAFRTAAVEPKQAALQEVLRRRGPGATAWIVADEWWTYWPVKYLALSQRRATVEGWRNAEASPEFREALAAGEVWSVEFSASAANQSARERFDAAAGYDELPIRDYAGRALISVLHARAAAAGTP